LHPDEKQNPRRARSFVLHTRRETGREPGARIVCVSGSGGHVYLGIDRRGISV
jgi:hypothetical protein